MSTDPTFIALPTPEHTAAWVLAQVEQGLAAARTGVAALKAHPPADAMAALRDFDAVETALSNVASVGSLFSEVHPLEEVRSAGEAAIQEVQRLSTELSLDRELYEVFAGLDATGLDADATRLLEKVRRDFRRAGVDQDDATRERITAINERLVLVGQEFSKNIRDDVRSIRVRPEQLDGLPQDWLDAHPAGEDGLVTVTTDYPDFLPVATYCTVRQTRLDLRLEFLNRAWPVNDDLLHELFDLRQELAGLVGYQNWADYDAEVKMIGRGSAIPEFIDQVTAAAEASGRRDLAVLLERVRVDRPDAEVVDSVDAVYYERLVQQEQYEVDTQKVRTYFTFASVRQGLLDVTGRLFGLTYVAVPDAPVWHPDVAAYDVHRGSDAAAPVVGRIYLDLHPREGKYKHAAQFDLVRGVEGRQLPEGVLVCNFPRGLMEHDQVVTLFHEFGHLVHHVLAGHVEWIRFSGVATEWDFVEAPSQMLEEWAWDAEVLRTFALDADGAAIPAELVAAMRRANDFGKGYAARTQMFYAAMAYAFHVERPGDITARTRELQERYSLFPYLEGTHMPCSFGHLEGYSSAYYTYMWSLVIAKDLFSVFRKENLFVPEVAGRYRDLVLARGGSADAADLVADFLGRPYTVDAYTAWLAQ